MASCSGTITNKDVCDGDSRQLGHQMDDVRVVNKQVAQCVAESQDQARSHALKHQAQPDADHRCRKHSTSVIIKQQA